MNKSIATVIKRFPTHWDWISRLSERDADFCALCGDYLLAKEALDRWQSDNSANVSNRIQEYRAVVSELEEEIHQYLLNSAKEYGNPG